MLPGTKNLKEVPQLAQWIALQGVAQLLCRLILDVATTIQGLLLPACLSASSRLGTMALGWTVMRWKISSGPAVLSFLVLRWFV